MRERKDEQLYIWFNPDPDTHRAYNSWGWYVYIGNGISYCLDEYNDRYVERRPQLPRQNVLIEKL